MDYTRFNDETLLQLIARSQENALSELYDRYSRLVYSVALNTLSDPGRAEEVTQDVFVRAWEKARTYSAEQGKVATWLASIARHRSIDLYRQSHSRHEDMQITWQDAEVIDSAGWAERGMGGGPVPAPAAHPLGSGTAPGGAETGCGHGIFPGIIPPRDR